MSAHNDGLVSHFLNRRFSRPLTTTILRFWPECNPNLISVISAIIGLLSALAFLAYLPALGGVLIQISSIVDGSDGEIARATGKESYFGGFFDSVLDRYVDIIIIMGMALFCLPFLTPTCVILLSTAAISGSYLVSYTAAMADSRDDFEFSRTIEGRDTRLFLIFLAGIAAIFTELAIPFCLVLITILTHSAVLFRILQVRRISLANSE